MSWEAEAGGASASTLTLDGTTAGGWRTGSGCGSHGNWATLRAESFSCQPYSNVSVCSAGPSACMVGGWLEVSHDVAVPLWVTMRLAWRGSGLIRRMTQILRPPRPERPEATALPAPAPSRPTPSPGGIARRFRPAATTRTSKVNNRDASVLNPRPGGCWAVDGLRQWLG